MQSQEYQTTQNVQRKSCRSWSHVVRKQESL